MTRRALLPVSALLLAALVPAAPAAAAGKSPVVKSVSPKKVKVGKKLTIRGKNFLPGKGKTRVFFVRVRGRGVAAAAARSGSRSKVVVTVPRSLNAVLGGGSARFKVRVLAKRFGAWTRPGRSPVIVASGSGDGGGAPNPDADCDADGTPNGSDGDDDNDALPDGQEGSNLAGGQIGTDRCNPDSDGDGIVDGFEYQSALDLNRTVLFGSRQPLPYPGKRPYPNPLYPDADVDYDGDGLTQGAEQRLWKRFGGSRRPLNYSDGLATTVPTPLPSGAQYQQMDSTNFGPDYNDGWLNDGERDADGDGLTNWDEFNGRMTPKWWRLAYDGEDNGPKETPYTITFEGTEMDDRDSDGDGVPDGLDDQDHDGLKNIYEVARPWNWGFSLPDSGGYISLHSGGARWHDGDNPWARVQPFNPCKPVFSQTCHRHPPFGYYEPDEDWIGMYPADAVSLHGAPGVVPGPIFP